MEQNSSQESAISQFDTEASPHYRRSPLQGKARRRGFTPYGPSKAALESETIIWSQELEGTGVTVNALLPGGATRTGMVPDSVSDQVRSKFLDPDIIVPPLIWLISEDADEVTGKRFVATKWRSDLRGREAADAAAETAGW